MSQSMSAPRLQHWDIFCRVIDNFGDIGVSWRLARQLVAEHGVQVRLWVDQIASLHALCPSVNISALQQTVEGVAVFQAAYEVPYAQPADVVTDVVVEAFGCGLPQAYIDAMTARKTKPLWIILEYLSAEPWVREHHGLPSPHPQLDWPRYFFFPGFTAGTGGVLREAALLSCRDAFDAQGELARRAFWSRLRFDDVPHDAITVSLFAYAHAPYAALLDACAQGPSRVVLAIPGGPLATGVRSYLQCGEARCANRGNLEVRFVPFVPQAEYDELLWACDINFVRGEDSFVRAQWAGRPFVWHIYPQAESAHRVKLDAFLNVFVENAAGAQAVRELWHAWNGVADAPPVAEAWARFIGARQSQQQNLRRWLDSLEPVGDLTGNLLKFCRKMI
jgi:uncharacterized repeat protein (TIGR03837 family)